ncbi:phosphoadenosine phosphosulfate reductase family protein [Caballeronia sp. LZ033]|uniref:phosphoadenosine phosphosulfate reductase family protein n=1 Tax=Caballeronia sp. LZ033 TaxID=3038566 RepID=UPI0028653AEC|nr:phosphoadenosine phosphosulfate reductase family protein [Caballeronia sp. LZ033]MDR5811990.1 phosphoadenosine phosphosulfate reductase family protein [Caballeronia sp. LZ033]
MVKVLVPISGGKDSQACLQLAIQVHGPDAVRGLFCDTQFEHPLTYEHVEWMRRHYGVQIDTVTGGSVIDKVRKYQRFPSGTARFCTDELKMRVTRDYLRTLAQEQGGVEVWYGMRSDESTQRATRYATRLSEDLYEPHEVFPKKYPKLLGKLGVRFRLPILDWSERDVFALLDGTENPLYAAGFTRVGCFPCLAAGDAHKEKAFNYDAFGQRQHVIVQILSAETGKSVWTSKGGKARNASPGCALCSM